MPVSEFQEILDEYFQSSRELLESAEELLLEIEREEGVPSPEQVQDLKRTFHTLKGNSAMMGFDVIANVAHLMEDTLSGVGRSELVVEDELISVLLSGMGLIGEVVRSTQVPEETPASWNGVLADLKRAAEALAAPRAAPEGSGARPSEVAAPSLDDLSRRYLGSRGKSLRVGQSKLDTLLELTGEIHVLLTGVDEGVQALSRGPDDALVLRVERLRKTFAFLHDEITSVRLVPIATVFSRFRRLVRDLAQSERKEIDFRTSGEETTLDKAIVDEIAEPLLHLVRNAVDHGIEKPDVREANGKPRGATITLAARQTSDRVEISIVDDGRGLDAALIRKRARERGIAVEGLDERAVYDLIFLPEFSTKDGVTELSGRGVGLDVVKSSVNRFGGNVLVQTLPGQGTEFRLRFPLTLAVGHALLVVVDGEQYAVPMNYLLEAVRLEPGSLHTLDQRPVLLWRGQLVPAVDAGRLLTTAARSEGRRGYALVLGAGAKRKALLVDRPLGNQLIVVKSLDETLGKPFGVSGATLLGSGQIVMILDAPLVLESHLDELRMAVSGAPA